MKPIKFALYTFVVLLASGTTAALHCDDRCSLKRGYECFADPKCIWESHEGSDGFNPMRGAMSELAERICPTITSEAATAAKEETVEEFLTSASSCNAFCAELPTTNCSALVADVLLGDGSVDDSENLRRLLESTDADDLTTSHRATLQSAVESSMNLMEFFRSYGQCMMCEECNDDPVDFFRDLRIFDLSDEQRMMERCIETFQRDDSDECSSRCDTERLHPEDCYKESEHCTCHDSSTSKDTCAADVLDMICAFRNDTTTEISNTCDRFVEKLSTFTDEITTNPYSVCRGFCQDFIGTCIPTPSYEGLITLTVEQEVYTPFQCAICERCKDDPSIFESIDTRKTCKTVLSELESSCDTLPAIQQLPQDSMCHGECSPNWEAMQCNSIYEEDKCYSNEACRWDPDSHDPFSHVFESSVSPHMLETLCPSMIDLIKVLGTASLGEETEVCETTMGCSEVPEGICHMFMGDDSEEDHHNRGLLSSMEGEKSETPVKRLMEIARNTGLRGRQLLQTNESDILSALPASDLVPAIFSCARCRICHEREVLSQMSWIAQMDPLPEEEFLQGCLSGDENDTSSMPESPCKPVCSTISSLNCALYPDYCTCQNETYYHREECYDDRGMHVPCDDYGYHGPHTPSCSCEAKREEDNGCRFNATGHCSEGCILKPHMEDHLGAYEASFMNDTLRILGTIMDQARQMDSVADIRQRDICTWVGECPSSCDDDDEDCNSCKECLDDKRVVEVIDILVSKRRKDWNTSMHDFAAVLYAREVEREMCIPDTCNNLMHDERGCQERPECEWNCHHYDVYYEGHSDYNMTVTSHDCSCWPDEFLERECTVIDGECSSGCVEHEHHGMSYKDIVSMHYEQNLIYVSMLTTRYKLEAGHHSFDWKESLGAHDICSWINNCSPFDACDTSFNEPTAFDSWDGECKSCWSCMTAKPVIEILDLFKYRSQSEWEEGLEEIAMAAAEEEAGREFCRPTHCDQFDDAEICSEQDHCHFGCPSYHDEEHSVHSDGEHRVHSEDTEGGSDEDDGCIDFMVRWAEITKKPDVFCPTQEDVSMKDCENTLYFLNAMTEFGHFASFNDRKKLCAIFSDGFPTTATIKQRLGFLYCDPSQQCCGTSPLITNSGISLPEKKCKNEPGCQFAKECVPVKDQCYETALAFSRNSTSAVGCTSGCAFVPSSSLVAIDTVDGRGTCVDLIMEETCKRSAERDCMHDGCMWKPSCTAEVGKDFGCLGADSCCVPTRDGIISEDQCSSDSCVLGKKCVRAVDECGYFHNEWDCNFSKGCHFVPVKNEFDRSAGRCVSKKDRCESLPQQACEVSNNCRLIDSCETSTCDPDDKCCRLDKQQCRRDPECSNHGACMMRKEFDVCAYYETNSTCQSHDGLCDWDEEGSSCKMSYDDCASFKISQECEYNEKCVFKETCVDACQLCSSCIDTFTDLQASIDDDTGTYEAQQIFIDFCLATGYDFFTCFRTGQKIPRSGGKLAQRPGAICLDLGACQESCKDPESNTAISRCSTTGWLIEADEEDEVEDVCSQCTSGEYCKLSSSDAKCRCNPQTGVDSCRPGGVCVDRCDKYSAKIEEYNRYVDSCSSKDECGTDFHCDTTVVARQMSCEAGTVQITSTAGACIPNARSISSAKFDNFGNVIEVELNFPALSLQFPASAIFNSATRELLGQAFCVVFGNYMKIFLRSGAKVKPGDTLKLANKQRMLVDVANRVPFENSETDVSVEGCDDCLEPTVLVNYPKRISGGCLSLDPPRAIFDGSFTSDLTGRKLTCQWRTDASNCYRETSSSSTSESCPVLESAIASETGRILELNSSVVAELATKPGFYTMQLTCTNFLEKEDTTEIEFEVLGVPMPVISVPTNVTYLRSEGLAIPASISQESVCPGDTVVYNWTSDDYAIPGGYLQRKDFRMSGYDSSIAGETYTLMLEAKLIQSDGSERDGAAVAYVSVTPQSSPVKSHLWGPSGDVVLTEDIVLYTFCEDPDDQENIEGSFDLDYFCLRGFEENGELSFDDSSTQPCEDFGTSTESNITLSAGSLVEDVWYIYTFTCSKSDREHSSTITFRPRSAESPIPTGQLTQLCSGECPDSHDPWKDLKLQIDSLAYEDTVVEWSCPSLTDALTTDQVDGGRLDAPRLTLLAGTLTEVESIDCMVKLTRNGHEGEVWIQMSINSAPYCSSEESSCVTAELVSETDEFPDAKYTISCTNFADDQEEALEYSFGCYSSDGLRRVFIKSAQSYYTLSALEIGNHTCFGCAIDKHGSEVCEIVDLAVNAPSQGISEDDLDSALDAVTTAENSGDIHAVLQTAGTVVNLVSYASENELVPRSSEAEAPSPPTRRLLSTEDEDTISMSSVVQPIVSTLGDFDPFDEEAFKPAVTQLAEIAPSLDFENLNTTVVTVESGLQASFLADTVYSEGDAEQLATDVANLLANYTTGWNSVYPIVDAVRAFLSLQNYAEDLLCMNLVLGDGEIIESSDGTVRFSCWKEAPSGLNNNTLSVGDVLISFSSNFSTACGEDCPESVELHASIFNTTTLHLSFIDSPVPVVGATDIAVTSHIISLGVADLDSGVLCEDPGCTLTVEVPVSSYNASKITACMRIDGATAVGLDEVSGISFQIGSYSSNNQSVLCEVSTLGDLFVVEFTDPSVFLNATVRSIQQNSENETPEQVVTAEMRFGNLNYTEYEADPALADVLKSRIELLMTEASTIEGAIYEVVELRPGSVIAIVNITLPSDSNQTVIDALIDVIQSDPEQLFDNQFIDDYGAPTLTVTQAPGMEVPSPIEEEGDSGDNNEDDDDKMMIVIIAVSIVGAIVLGSLALFLCVKAFGRSSASYHDVHGNSYLD